MARPESDRLESGRQPTDSGAHLAHGVATPSGYDPDVARRVTGTSYLPEPAFAPIAADVSFVAEDDEPLGPVPYLAGAAVALLGGIVWALVVIATKFDFGILAWLVGAATGLALSRVAVRPVGPATRVLAGMFAAAGIVVGKYVIFVHEVKVVIATEFSQYGASTGYLDPRQVRFFLQHLTEIVRPVYLLWLALAFFAAFRTAGGQSILRRAGGPGRAR